MKKIEKDKVEKNNWVVHPRHKKKVKKVAKKSKKSESAVVRQAIDDLGAQYNDGGFRE